MIGALPKSLRDTVRESADVCCCCVFSGGGGAEAMPSLDKKGSTARDAVAALRVLRAWSTAATASVHSTGVLGCTPAAAAAVVAVRVGRPRRRVVPSAAVEQSTACRIRSSSSSSPSPRPSRAALAGVAVPWCCGVVAAVVGASSWVAAREDKVDGASLRLEGVSFGVKVSGVETACNGDVGLSSCVCCTSLSSRADAVPFSMSSSDTTRGCSGDRVDAAAATAAASDAFSGVPPDVRDGVVRRFPAGDGSVATLSSSPTSPRGMAKASTRTRWSAARQAAR